MNKISIRISLLSVLFLSFLSTDIYSQTREVRRFTLQDVITRAQEQSPAAKQAETRKEVQFQQNRLFLSDYSPQFRLSGSIPSFNRSFTQVTQPDGTIQFQPVRQTTSTGRLFLEQPLAFSGGSVFVNSESIFFNDIDRNTQLWSGTLVNVQLNQPLFAFNRLKWDRKIEPLRYEESRRSYVEEMESVSSTAVDRFFQLLQAQVRLEIANFNLANTDTILKIEKNRYNIGTTTEDKVLQVELSYLNEQQNVAQAELDFESASLRLRSFIGLNEDVEIDLILPDEIPQLVVDYMTALNYAKENRADYLAFERERLEAEASVAQAKGNRFQVNFNASYGLNNRAGQFADIYVDPNSQQRANITFNVPILDWGRNKSRMAIAAANMQLTEFTIAQDLINFEQEIRTQVTQIDMLSKQIELAKKTDEVADKRYTVSQGRYLTGSTTILELNQALSDKDSKRLQYITSLRDYWSAYYNLRRLTLYDFANDRLLYNPALNN